jgi:hypothetical protein
MLAKNLEHFFLEKNQVKQMGHNISINKTGKINII